MQSSDIHSWKELSSCISQHRIFAAAKVLQGVGITALHQVSLIQLSDKQKVLVML